jgi:hypothetical protein
MHRMGHSSMRAALIYQHATSERDKEIAAGMDKRIAKRQGAKATKPRRPKRRERQDSQEDTGTANAS